MDEMIFVGGGYGEKKRRSRSTVSFILRPWQPIIWKIQLAFPGIFSTVYFA
jgi:hypothetical protein